MGGSSAGKLRQYMHRYFLWKTTSHMGAGPLPLNPHIHYTKICTPPSFNKGDKVYATGKLYMHAWARLSSASWSP